MFDRSRCVITTSTLSKNLEEVRSRLVIRTAEEAEKLGYPFIVVDGSPFDGLRLELEKRGALVFPENEPGIGPARSQGFDLALQFLGREPGASIFIEPEKAPIVRHLQGAFEMVLDGRADIVSLCRSQKGLRSYPELQQRSEKFGNYSFELATGRALDMFFGARVVSRRVLQELYCKARPNIPGSNSWGITHYPVMEAIALGLRVISLEIDYLHPPEQTAAENTPFQYMRRVDQVHQLSAGTFAYAMQLGLIPEDQDLLRRFEAELATTKGR